MHLASRDKDRCRFACVSSVYRKPGYTLPALLLRISLNSAGLRLRMTIADFAVRLLWKSVFMERRGFTLLELLVVMSIYMIKIDRPPRCGVRLKKPCPSGMRLRKKDGDDYILWRPKRQQIGTHQVTVAFEGEQTSEKEVTVYVYTHEALKALQKDRKAPH